MDQLDIGGWHSLGSYTTDGHVKIEVHYRDSRVATGRTGAIWRSVGLDAVAMRCDACPTAHLKRLSQRRAHRAMWMRQRIGRGRSGSPGRRPPTRAVRRSNVTQLGTGAPPSATVQHGVAAPQLPALHTQAVTSATAPTPSPSLPSTARPALPRHRLRRRTRTLRNPSHRSLGTRRTNRHRLHVPRLPTLPPQHPRPRLHRHQNQHRLQNHQPQQPAKRPLNSPRVPLAWGTSGQIGLEPDIGGPGEFFWGWAPRDPDRRSGGGPWMATQRSGGAVGGASKRCAVDAAAGGSSGKDTQDCTG